MGDLITAHEAATLLRMHVKRIQRLAREGKLPAVRYGRKWLFRRSELVGGRSRVASTLAVDVDLSTSIELSARNQLRGRIADIRADGVMAEVTIRIGDQELVSVITSASVRRLGLVKGDDVIAVIKSTEVMVGKVADR